MVLQHGDDGTILETTTAASNFEFSGVSATSDVSDGAQLDKPPRTVQWNLVLPRWLRVYVAPSKSTELGASAVAASNRLERFGGGRSSLTCRPSLR